MKKNLLIIMAAFLLLPLIADEENEAFGFESEPDSQNCLPFQYTIGGQFSIGGAFFFDELRKPAEISPGSPIAVNLHLHTAAPFTEAHFGVCVDDRTLVIGANASLNSFPAASQIPPWIDEAYLKLLFGSVVFSGGIQKITWGRAEFLSILDIINPLDKTKIPSWSRQVMKLARPLFSATVYAAESIKFEAVFLPIFEGHHISLDGYLQDRNVLHAAYRYAGGQKISLEQTATNTLDYAQGGGRCSFTLFDTHDVGVQYFYGRLHNAAIIKQGSSFVPIYNLYHHIGIDYGTAVGPFSIWAEAAAAITKDLHGSDTAIYNPFFEWNSGFSYTAPYGFSLNMTAAQRITLHHTRILSGHDVEYGRTPTATTVYGRVSQSLLRGALEWRLGGSVDIENAVFCVMPGVQWLFASFMVDCTAGIFSGKPLANSQNPFDSSFIKLTVSYSF